MTKKNFNKIQNFFKQELTTELEHFIVSYKHGEYELFGKYRIYKNNDGFYAVSSKVDPDINAVFLSLRNAVSWCTLLSNKMKFEAKQIEKLDRHLSSVDVNIEIHKKLLGNQSFDFETRWTYQIKLQDDIRKRKQINVQLKSLINTAKRIQQSKFSTLKKKQFS